MPTEVLDFRISPNPATREFFAEINLKSVQKITFRLTDASDKTLIVKQLKGKSLRERFDVSALPAGTYFLKMELGEGGILVRQVVVE